MNTKTQNLAILQATRDLCDLYTVLSKGIASTREQQYVVYNYEKLKPETIQNDTNTNVILSGKDCFIAATAYRGKKTTVVNFGSREMPEGTGVDQESSMCRTSTIHKCLAYKELWKEYYFPSKVKKPLFTDIVYSPDIIVFKSESDPMGELPEEEWFKVDVLTTSLPVMANEKRASETFKLEADESREFSKEEFENLLYGHFSRLFQVAYQKGTEVLILPAPGKNSHIDEKVLVGALKRATEEFDGAFDTVEFAIATEYNCKKTKEAFQKGFPGAEEL